MAIGRKSLLGDGLGAVKVSEPGKVSSDWRAVKSATLTVGDA